MCFTFNDDIHSVPKFEIYVDEQLNFTLHWLLWSVPAKHDLYCSYKNSVTNVTISRLISHMSSLSLCSGLSKQFSEACISHCVPKIFFIDNRKFPLHQ